MLDIALLANLPVIAAGIAFAVVLIGVLGWTVFGKRAREERLERAIRREVAQGLFHRAVPYYMERGMWAEAAALEARRGKADQAAKLYERAKDLRSAVDVYRAAGDLEMAALTAKKAGYLEEAAELYLELDKPIQAAEIFEDAGKHARAADVWRESDDLGRAAKALESAGDKRAADGLRAELAEQSGEWEAAARTWEKLGEIDRAVKAFTRGGRPAEAARLKAAQGDHKAATVALMNAGDWRGAAETMAKQGQFKEAAQIAYRAGNLAMAVNYLEKARDFVTIGRIYMSYGRKADAKERLASVRPADAQYVEATEMLAMLEVEDGRSREAYQLYEGLVKRAVDAGKADDDVRRWLVAMTETLLQHGKRDGALRCLHKLRDLGLMTPDLEDKLKTLEAPEPKEKAKSKAQLTQLSMTLNLPRHERYLFESKLAQGGNGVIYRAVDKILGRKLVIKMILDSALPDDLTKRWFFREAQVAAQLNHPNIVTIYDLSELDGQPYIAMEYVEGVDLSEELDGKLPLNPAEAAKIFKPLCGALQYAHDRKVIHRDIKLENVMLTATGDIKLMDFGLAKAMQGGTKTVVVAGTPSYMSPEQIMNDEVDHRTDVYAIGVMLFKVLTGRFPFEGGSEVLIQHVTEPPPDIRECNAALPEALSPVIAKALAKEKKDRYDSVETLCEEFAKACSVA